MPYADGSSSSFPASADDFVIKWPFGEDRINGTTTSTRNDLERASHVNVMMDAALNLEEHIQNRVAGSVQAREGYSQAGSVTPTGGLQMMKVFYTLPVSGTGQPWFQYNLDIPSRFGTAPLNNWRFSINPTVYVSTGRAASSIQGVATMAEYENSFMTALNMQPHLLTMIMPNTGNAQQYCLCIKALGLSDDVLSLTDKSFSDFQSDGSRPKVTQSLGNGWNSYGDDNAAAVAHVDLSSSAPGSLLALSSQGQILGTVDGSREGNYGIQQVANLGTMTDQEIRFRPYTWKLARPESSGVMNRAGFFVRWNGQAESPSFYCVTIAEQTLPSNAYPASGILYRVRNFDTFTNDVPYTSGVLSTVTAAASMLGTFPIHWYIENSGTYTNVLYSLRVVGDVITVRESLNGGGAWSTLLTVTDASAQKLTTGTVGAVTFPLSKPDPLGRNPRNSRITAFDKVTGLSLDAGVAAEFKVQTLFCMQGTPNTQGETESV